MIAASAPIDRSDIAFIICFLVHKEAGVDRVKRFRSKSQPRASRLGRKLLHKLNSNRKVTGEPVPPPRRLRVGSIGLNSIFAWLRRDLPSSDYGMASKTARRVSKKPSTGVLLFTAKNDSRYTRGPGARSHPLQN